MNKIVRMMVEIDQLEREADASGDLEKRLIEVMLRAHLVRHLIDAGEYQEAKKQLLNIEFAMG
jgi:hypothetical protein